MIHTYTHIHTQMNIYNSACVYIMNQEQTDLNLRVQWFIYNLYESIIAIFF